MTTPSGKATLREADNPGAGVTFGLNPTQIQFSRSVKFNRPTSANSKSDPSVQFTGTDPTQLQVQLLLDAMTVPNGSIQGQIDQLVAWTKVPDDSPASSPPRLAFTWGSLKIGKESAFLGFLEQLRVTIEMFGRDGAPRRASVSLSLKSGIYGPPPPTNPTSGTDVSRRRRVLQRGQSLQLLAYEEFRDAGAWRAVAELNGIDDPMRLRTGREVLLPDPQELTGARQ